MSIFVEEIFIELKLFHFNGEYVFLQREQYDSHFAGQSIMSCID